MLTSRCGAHYDATDATDILLPHQDLINTPAASTPTKATARLPRNPNASRPLAASRLDPARLAFHREDQRTVEKMMSFILIGEQRAMRIVGTIVVGVVMSTACTGGASDTRLVRRDSAGIAIIESASPRWQSTEAWSVDTVPVLDLTRTGTGINHEFDQLVDALRLADGSIVVADRGFHQVRRFAPSGRFAWALGRDGEGPGEFRRLASLARFRGDSIVAFDYWLGRATVISGTGQIGRSFYPYQPGPSAEKLLRLDDTTFVAPVPANEQMVGKAGLFRIPASIVTISSAGTVLDTLTTVPGSETFIFPRGDMRPLFGRHGHVAAAGDRVYVGTAEQLEFTVYAPSGQLERIVRVPGRDLSLSSEEVEREREFMLGANPRPLLQNLVAQLPSPATRPAYAQLVVDATGAVWTADFRAQSDTVGPRPWQVFAPDGEWLGATELPRRLRVFEIGRDYVLGAYPDMLDVQHVQVLRLRRGARGR